MDDRMNFQNDARISQAPPPPGAVPPASNPAAAQAYPPAPTMRTAPQAAPPSPEAQAGPANVPPTSQWQTADYRPAPIETGGFGLSLAGLITASLGVSLVGLILSIVGLRKSRVVKRATDENKKANASFVMGIIGTVLGGLGLLAEIILAIVLLVGGIAVLPSMVDGLSSTVTISSPKTAAGVFSGEDAKAVANDLKKTLLNDLKASKCKDGALQVKSLKVDSSKWYVDSAKNNCRTVKGSAVIDYGGKTREVVYVVDYVEAGDGNWYLYNYTFDSYDIFPAQFVSNSGVEQGLYEPAEIGPINETPAAPDRGGQNAAPTRGVAEVGGSYYEYAGIPNTLPYSGVSISISDTPIYAEVGSDGTMELSYSFSGIDSTGYVSVDLPVDVYGGVSGGGRQYAASGGGECEGVYSNQVGGGMAVSSTVYVSVDATIAADGTMTGTVTQSLVSYSDPSGMYNPSGAFDVSFDFTAYRS